MRKFESDAIQERNSLQSLRPPGLTAVQVRRSNSRKETVDLTGDDEMHVKVETVTEVGLVTTFLIVLYMLMSTSMDLPSLY